MKNKKRDVKTRLFRIFVIVLAVWVVFLIYSNIDLSKSREYVFYEGINVSGDYIPYEKMIVGGAEPIFLPRGENAVLLLHGLGGTPIEMKELAYYLADRNISVFVPLMPNQGMDYDSIGKLDMEGAYLAALSYYDILKKHYSNVYVGGLSSGGLLSLKIAENENVSGVLSYASPIVYGFNFFGDSTKGMFKVIGFLTPNVRRIEWGLSRNESIADALPSFDRMPVKTLLEDEYLTDEVKANLNKISSPILILQSVFDNRAAPGSANYIYDNVNSKQKGIVWLSNSGHVITMDFDKQRVFNESADFILKN